MTFAVFGCVVGLLMTFIVILGGDPEVKASACVTGKQSDPAGGPAPAPASIPGYDAEQVADARIIAITGSKLGVPAPGELIAIMTAMQESQLHNLNYGDADSIGLFQQRANWGTAAQRHDPTYASTRFFKALTAVQGWKTMELWQAADAVQHPATANLKAYARWENPARGLLQQLHVTIPTCDDGAPGGVSSSAFGKRVVAYAHKWVGKAMYCMGCGDQHGPTNGSFDCSGLTLYAIAQASKQKILLPHAASKQFPQGKPVTKSRARPGDLIFFHIHSDPTGYLHHVGVYIGGGKMISAPDYGQAVKVETVFPSSYWSQQTISFARFG